MVVFPTRTCSFEELCEAGSKLIGDTNDYRSSNSIKQPVWHVPIVHFTAGRSGIATLESQIKSQDETAT